MAAIAWLLRSKRPLIALGLGWFLAAHVLTSNILPLELAFEHRNYFASIGLLLAAIDFLAPQGGAQFSLARQATICGMLALSIVSLGLRAKVWGDPVTFAINEAPRHPTSLGATYDLRRTYALLGGYRPDSPSLPLANSALELAANVPNVSALPESPSS